MELYAWCSNKKCDVCLEIPEREYHHLKDGLVHNLTTEQVTLLKYNLCLDCHSESIKYLYPGIY
jgi:hypothetical protein